MICSGMLKRTVGLLIPLTLVLGGCPKGADPTTPPAGDPAASPATAGQVCCESFGYGSMMVKCCESYAWTAPAECVVAPDMAGGGMEIVDDAKCN